MKSKNPAVIPRNHRVEETLTAAVERNDLAPMRRLLEVLENPFSDSQEKSPFREPAPEGGELYQTFCGT
jgi:uncharacterized protein YdiU (UPF0061 family)